MIFLFILSAIALLSVLLIFAVGCYTQYFAGVRPKSRGDDNYHPDTPEDDFKPSGITHYKVESHRWNIWWHKQPLERLDITSHDGLRLAGYLRRANKPTRRIALVLHGIDSVAGEMGFISNMFLGLGYHVVAVDLRAHGASEGRMIGFGYYERFDIIRWLNHISALFQDDCEFVLYGSSMGAASVMMAAGERDLSDHVVCAIEDSGFSCGDEVLYCALVRDYKALPFKRAAIGVACALQKLRAGYSFKQVNCVAAVSRARLPMLFVHGDNDIAVPFSMLDEVYAAHPGEKQKLIVPGGKHAIGFFADEALFTDAVKAFCDKYFTVD